MPDLSLQFDPVSEDAANVPFELVSDATGARLVEQNYPAPVPVVTWASSADSEGERNVSYRWPNRKISLKVEIVGTAATVKTRLGNLEQKVAKIAREGGTLKHTYPDGTFVVFDLLALEGYEPALNIEYFVGNAAMVQLEFQAKPFARGVPVTLPDRVETTLPVLVFTETGVTGDAPALGRLIVDEDQGADQQWVVWGMQRDSYSSSANAALFYEAEGRTPQSGGATAVQAGASGAGSNVVEATVGTAFSSVLSTQATGGGAHLSHFGTYRVFARVLTPTANSGAVSFALEWAEGDFRRYSRHSSTVFPVDLWDNTFRTIDLGVVSISKVQQGAQQWEGRILAKSTFPGDKVRVDCLWLVPTERSGEVESVTRSPAPTVYSAQDAFSQTAGVLTGKSLVVGGTWQWGGAPGDADDFNVTGTGAVTRTVGSDASGVVTNGRLVTASTPSLVNTVVSVDATIPITLFNGALGGVVCRYVNATNFLCAFVLDGDVAASPRWLFVQKVVAGVATTIAGSFDVVTGTANTIRLTVTPYGSFLAEVLSGGAVVESVTGDDAVLATGGTLSSGKVGILDYATATTPGTRTYDNFYAYSPPVDAAVFASQSIEWRHDGVLREDSTGTIYQRPSQYEGNYLTIPPYAQESKTTRFIVKASRSIPGVGADSAIDDISARLTITPRFLVMPEPPPPPFTPTSIAGLAAWYDASQIPSLADGDPVASWADLSGNSRTLSQGTSAARPTYKTAIQNGRAIVRFDGVDDFMQSGVFTLAQPINVFIVVNWRTNAADASALDGLSGITMLIRQQASRQINVFAGVDLSGPASVTDVWRQYGVVFSGASSEIRVDGGAATAGNAGTGSPGGLTVGARGGAGSAFGAVDIAEVLAYDSALSTVNRQSVEAYLKTKWATP